MPICDTLCVRLATRHGQEGVVVMEPFRIHVADEVLDDLRARLRHTRWPDQVPGIGWQQGTELDWLRRRVSYWAHEFDWRAWERRLNALNHFIWEGIHFVYQRAASGRSVPLILTHGWPSSFLDYVDMLPMLEHFDVVVPSLPGYGFSPRPPKVGINYRYVSRHTCVRSGTPGATLRRPTTSSAPRSPCTGSHRASLRRCATIGTIAGTRSIPPTSARPRRLVFSRTRPFPRANCRGRIWSAYTTFSAGQSVRAAGTSPQLRNQRRSQGSSPPSSV